jgi:kynureninase
MTADLRLPADLRREDAEAEDARDELAGMRERFVVTDPDLLYFDGNSLGRLPARTPEFLARVIQKQWGTGLIRSWDEWIDWNTALGDRLAQHVLGAPPGEVVLSDSTSVNLYKLAAAALDARSDRKRMLVDAEDFPTNRYIVQGLAQERGLTVQTLRSNPNEGLSLESLQRALDDDVAVVVLSLVSYRSGALLDMAAVNRVVHDVGAVVVWDLSHAAGVVPIELERNFAQLAVGCTYKYLNGGPGAPAFLYVRRELQPLLRQPIWGWFGQRGQFRMGAEYEPTDTIHRFLVGTPPVLSLAAVEPALQLIEEAGIERIRAKALRAGEWLVALGERRLTPLGFRLASPSAAERRGSHVSFEHPEAFEISRALRAYASVIADYRRPDLLRLGPAPLSTRFVDLWDAIVRIERLVLAGEHRNLGAEAGRVT